MRTSYMITGIILVLFLNGCTETNLVSPYFPCKLIDSAILYKLNEEDYFPGVECGIIPHNLRIDSIKLNVEEWKKLVRIASKKESQERYVIDCFQPAFVVIFKSKNDHYVSHLTVSLYCRQIKYADEGRLHFMTIPHRDELKLWFNEILS